MACWAQGVLLELGTGIQQGGGGLERKICVIHWRRGQGARETSADPAELGIG